MSGSPRCSIDSWVRWRELVTDSRGSRGTGQESVFFSSFLLNNHGMGSLKPERNYLNKSGFPSKQWGAPQCPGWPRKVQPALDSAGALRLSCVCRCRDFCASIPTNIQGRQQFSDEARGFRPIRPWEGSGRMDYFRNSRNSAGKASRSVILAICIVAVIAALILVFVQLDHAPVGVADGSHLEIQVEVHLEVTIDFLLELLVFPDRR